MASRFSRLLLVFAALLLAIGGTMHAAAFGRTVDAVAASNLPAFFAGSLKLLWLADFAAMFVLAAVFSLIAARPAAARGSVIMLLALLPAGTAALIYNFLGSFFAGHLLLVTAAAAFLAGLQLSQTASRKSTSSLNAPVAAN